ncbi:MAG: helix-turn-helix domain-containing protein [bacterium]|nr:helix-turn-helix domain-containing protein [Acidimicrobiia bacterium]MCY4649628.1 helix-turn-helix domain-containing protein [bacterium]
MTQRTSRRPSAGPTFGEILESFRRRRGFKRRQIARQLGVTQGQVKDWERGAEIPIHPGLLRSLEAILETPEGILVRAAGFSAPVPDEPKMTIQESLASLASPEDEATLHPMDLQEELLPVLPPAPAEPSGGPSGLFSYRYNPPEERWVYRIRFLLTGAGLALLGLLLIWAAGRVWGELGTLWDAVFG